MRIWGFSVTGVAFFAVLILGVVLGVMIGGGTGTTVTAITAGLLALTVFGAGTSVIFIGREPLGRRRPDPPPEDEGFRDGRR